MVGIAAGNIADTERQASAMYLSISKQGVTGALDDAISCHCERSSTRCWPSTPICHVTVALSLQFFHSIIFDAAKLWMKSPFRSVAYTLASV